MAYRTFSELDENIETNNKNYKSFIQYGSAINNQVESPFNASNPLTYCLFPTMGTSFQHGSSIAQDLTTTYNPKCEYFMAERCSLQWDGFCEAYKVLNIDTYWPNSAVIDSKAYTFAQQYLKNNRPTVGEIMIRNSVNLKFIAFPGVSPDVEQFDPNTANSPDIKMYSNYITTPSVIKSLKNINIEKDEHVSLMLEYPTPCFDVLARLYLGFIRGEPTTKKIKGTRLEKFFQNNETLFNSFIQQAISVVNSFQVKPISQISTCTNAKRNI